MRTRDEIQGRFAPQALSMEHLAARGAIAEHMQTVFLALAAVAQRAPAVETVPQAHAHVDAAFCAVALYAADHIAESADRTAGLRLLWTARMRAHRRISAFYAGHTVDWTAVVSDLEAAEVQFGGVGDAWA